MTIRSNDWKGVILANGRYVITAKLGEGGMGSVYRALDRNIEADVVIKAPRQAMMEDPDFAGRFTREIRSLVKLSHPHIVKVSDVGEWEGAPFAVMQFLSGGSLEDRRQSGPDGQPRPCDPKEVPRWLGAVAQALDYVHAQGYVHRDVKPGNILFDAEGHAFLSDFGVAKVLASSAGPRASATAVTGAGMVLGTPEYMAPELIMGEPFDGRVDQYALAVTVYELLCGRRPFEDDTKTRVLVLHTSKAPPALTDWCPALPERLSRSVLKGMAKDPNERYPSCAALAAAVAAAAARSVARDDRVRLTCPACGTAGWLTAADLAKLKESGRRLTCSACKAPLDLSGAGAEQAAPGTRSGGTKVFSQSDRPAEPALPREPGPGSGGTMALSARAGSGEHASPRAAKSTPGGTQAMSAPVSQVDQPPGGEARPASARGGSQTVIESAAPQSHEDPATAVFKALAGSESERLKGPERNEAAVPSGVAGAPPRPARTWLAVGAVVLGLLLVLTFVVWGLGPRRAKIVTAPAPSPPVTSAPTPVAPGQSPAPSSPSSSPADTPAPKPTELARAPATKPTEGSRPDASENRPSAGPSTSGSKLAAPRPAESKEMARLASSAKGSPAAINRGNTSQFDPEVLARKPVKEKGTLKKILDASRFYSNQVVVPDGMYLLAHSHADRVDGPRKYLVTERKIEERKNNSLGMSSSPSTDLAVEPKLAERLDQLETDLWKDKMSILTLWFTRDGAGLLVKVEILEKATPRVKRVGYSVQADIEYETLLVTTEETRPFTANDAEWEQVGRMHSYAKAYKSRFKAYKQMVSNAQMNMIQTQMNGLFQNMMQNALIEDQKRLQLQRQLTR